MSELTGQGLLHLPPAWGPGPPVLLVHGAHHGAGCWDGWVAALAVRGVPAAALDLRGHGVLAAGGLSPMTGVQDYAEDVAAAVAALPRPPVLVGHSLGALVVFVAVATLGVPVAGLVLVAPSPPGNLPGVAAVPTIPGDAPWPPPDEAQAVARWMGGEPPPETVLRPWLAGLCPESPRAMNERYALTVTANPARVTAPVLVIEAGRDDRQRHPPGQDAALARFLRGDHVLLPDAPHCLMLGEWCDRSADVLADWIGEHVPA